VQVVGEAVVLQYRLPERGVLEVNQVALER
jgi:hypothetical protein